MQNVWDITETVMEERVVEEIPPNTGASPVMPVNREMQNDRRVEQMYWRSTSTRGGGAATPRS